MTHRPEQDEATMPAELKDIALGLAFIFIPVYVVYDVLHWLLT